MPGENKITIPEPEAGRSLHFTMQPDQVYLLGFSPETSTFEQVGQDVRVIFESGADIVLHDFFSVAEQRDFTLELRDGTQISGRDMAKVLAMSLKDFHTDGEALAAAGMAAETTSGFGANGAGNNEGHALRLEDVLDVRQPALLAGAPGEARPGVHSVTMHDPACVSNPAFAEENAAASAGQSVPGESADLLLLALLRIDM